MLIGEKRINYFNKHNKREIVELVFWKEVLIRPEWLFLFKSGADFVADYFTISVSK